MPHNFTRPNLPYANVSLPNDNRFQVLTRTLNAPPTDIMYDSEYNYMIDGLNILDNDIINVVAGNIPGSNVPTNVNHLLTTDGNSNLSWILIGANNVSPGSLPATVLINSSITSLQIADGAITNTKLGPNSVGQGNLSEDSVGTNQIQDNAVGTNELALLSVTAAQMANQTITATQMANQTITQTQMTNNSIGTSQLIDANVTLAKMAPNSVGTSNLIDGSVTLPKIGPNVLTNPAQKGDQIAGTSTTVYTNPAVQQNHPSAAKFLCYFDGTLTGTNPPLWGYNIASITRISLGLYTVNFIVPFANTTYVVGLSSQAFSSNPNLIPLTIGLGALNTTSFQFTLRDTSGVAKDSPVITLMGFGLQ